MLLLILRWEVLGQAGIGLRSHHLQIGLMQDKMYG